MGDYNTLAFTLILFTGILFLFSIMIVLFMVIYQKKKLAAEILKEKEKNQFQETLMTAIIKAQDDEKTNIGRELHDNINGLMMMAKLNVQKLSGNSNDALISIEEAMKHTRELSHGLSFSILETYGLEYTIDNYINRIGRNVDYAINLNLNIADEPNLNTSKQVFRILQEAVMNVTKYSKAKTLNIEINGTDKKLEMIIIDNGIGFNIDDTNTGIGLHNMYLRAKSISADLLISSKEEEGTSVTLIVHS